jgi:hypothetical protein
MLVCASGPAQIAGFIWLGMNMSWFGHRAKALALDYTNSHWAVSYLPYYIIQLSVQSRPLVASGMTSANVDRPHALS